MEQQQSLQGIVVQMTKFLEEIYDTEMIAFMQKVEQAPCVVDWKEFSIEEDNQKAAALVQLYGRLWGVKNLQERGKHDVSSLSE